ncbi:MAG TPA: ABC transporter ATP-binding protein, partial [Methylophilaceae bacterium]|nr:ABC transporter ATP-binding protein [Methylophilaceae bacterium]
KTEKAAAIAVSDKPAAKNDRAQNKAERQARLAERRPLVKEAEQLESRLESWQKEKAELDQRLADAELYTAAAKAELQELLKRQAAIVHSIEQAEMRWLEIHELLEALPVS